MKYLGKCAAVLFSGLFAYGCATTTESLDFKPSGDSAIVMSVEPHYYLELAPVDLATLDEGEVFLIGNSYNVYQKTIALDVDALDEPSRTAILDRYRIKTTPNGYVKVLINYDEVPSGYYVLIRMVDGAYTTITYTFQERLVFYFPAGQVSYLPSIAQFPTSKRGPVFSDMSPLIDAALNSHPIDVPRGTAEVVGCIRSGPERRERTFYRNPDCTGEPESHKPGEPARNRWRLLQ